MAKAACFPSSSNSSDLLWRCILPNFAKSSPHAVRLQSWALSENSHIKTRSCCSQKEFTATGSKNVCHVHWHHWSIIHAQASSKMQAWVGISGITSGIIEHSAQWHSRCAWPPHQCCQRFEPAVSQPAQPPTQCCEAGCAKLLPLLSFPLHLIAAVPEARQTKVYICQ